MGDIPGRLKKLGVEEYAELFVENSMFRFGVI